jgi:hypothetical protein
LVNYSYEWLSYKIGLTESAAWSRGKD